MKNRKMAAGLATAAMLGLTVAVCGCNKSTVSDTPSEPIRLETPQTGNTANTEVTGNTEDAVSSVTSEVAPAPAEQTKDTTALTGQDTQNTSAQVPFTAVVNVAYENGSPDIVEHMDINAVSDRPGENDNCIYGYDEVGNLIYKRSTTSHTDDKGIINVTITYDFYSLDYGFDYYIDPLDPENGGNIQTITGSLITREGTSESVKDFTFETVQVRGATGIWYAGICSCRNGKVGDYIIP